MELINPRLTVQNTDQHFWLVRMEHSDTAAMEHIDVQLKVRRQVPVALGELQAQLLDELARRISEMLGSLRPYTPSGDAGR
jgi:hypothetical protein